VAHSGYLPVVVQACTHTRICFVQRSGRLDYTVFLPGDDVIEKSLHPFLSKAGALEVDCQWLQRTSRGAGR